MNVFKNNNLNQQEAWRLPKLSSYGIIQALCVCPLLICLRSTVPDLAPYMLNHNKPATSLFSRFFVLQPVFY